MTAPDPVRAGRALDGVAAGALVLEAITVLFVPRAIAQTAPGLTGVRLTLLLVLAGVLIVAAGLQRRSWGLVAGTVLQVPLLLTGLMTPAMWFLGGIFVVIWLYLLKIRKDLLGRPFGAPSGAAGGGEHGAAGALGEQRPPGQPGQDRADGGGRADRQH